MAFNIPPVARPDHVDAARVLDFDVYALQAQDAEYQLLIRRIVHDPAVPSVFWTPQNGGHWVAGRADVIDKVLSDAERFSSQRISVLAMLNPPARFAPLQYDPPDHLKFRQLLAPAFSPQAVGPLGVKARALAIELIEGFKARGRCEFIGEFAAQLPIAIFMAMAGLPAEDRPLLMEVADALVRVESLEASAAAGQKLAGYTMQKITERRANPGDDLVSRLVQSRIEGELLDDMTLLGMINLLLLAGLDTVASMMGFFTRFLATQPEVRHRLAADPKLIPGAIEEMLRRFPVANLARLVRQDCELEGAVLKAGEMVLAPTAAFGLDDQRFDAPESVDIERKRNLHATFGGGLHRCLGSMLARVELKVFLEEWLPRIPDFEIEPGTALRVNSGSVASMPTLPLVWKTAA